MVYLTRREVFSASHRLHNNNLSDSENLRIFGKCNNPHGHGHNYILEVTVCGDVNPNTGYVIDLTKLKQILKENIIDHLDHKHLNYDVQFLKDIIPTTENLTIAIWNQLIDKIIECNLYSVKIFETENNYFEYKGD
ncbi:MAG: 6-carboxytetrahydropterin synthase [bacterium]